MTFPAHKYTHSHTHDTSLKCISSLCLYVWVCAPAGKSVHSIKCLWINNISILIFYCRISCASNVYFTLSERIGKHFLTRPIHWTRQLFNRNNLRVVLWQQNMHKIEGFHDILWCITPSHVSFLPKDETKRLAAPCVGSTSSSLHPPQLEL